MGVARAGTGYRAVRPAGLPIELLARPLPTRLPQTQQVPPRPPGTPVWAERVALWAWVSTHALLNLIC